MNGPQLVCAACAKPTTMFKPICDACMRLTGQQPRPEAELIAEENVARVAGGLAPMQITLDLTPEQAALLTAHFDWASREFTKGLPGMLVAQVYRCNEPPQRFAMKVGLVDHARAKLLERQ